MAKMNLLERAFPGLAAKREASRLKLTRMKVAIQTLETIPSFAQDEDEGSWVNLNQEHSHYTETDIKTMQEQARKDYLVNPSVRGLIDDMCSFVIGKECNTTFVDKKAQDLWKLWTEKNDWDVRKEECLRRKLRDGEFFARMFEPVAVDTVSEPDPTTNIPHMRFVDPDEIRDHTGTHSFGIETDPNDVETPVNYYRTFTQNGTQTHETIPASEMIHCKMIADSNEKRGYSWLLGTIKFIKKYEKWLNDRIRLNYIRGLFNLIATPDGISASAAAELMPDATTQGTGGDTINKKMPKPGTLIFSRGMKYEFASLDMKAQDTAHDGRHIERMICKGTSLVEGVVTGDYSNNNFASALISESPMIKNVEKKQDRFGNDISKIAMWVFRWGQRNNLIDANADESHSTAFTSLVHRELLDDTTAYQVQRGNGWISDRTASGLLGLDYDEEQEQIKLEDVEERKRSKEREADADGGANPRQRPALPGEPGPNL